MARSPEFGGEPSKVTTVLRAIGNTKRLRILNELSDGQGTICIRVGEYNGNP